ncbi:MAG TPA: hypothetical protein GXZ82_07165 [Firmicutes bacterium]|jgi:uncharacterized protein YprB with RNaseH-like and TPR domain|nr:hypothetical protein [Bacillota bacterium]
MSLQDRIKGRVTLQRAASNERTLVTRLDDLEGREHSTPHGVCYVLDLTSVPSNQHTAKPGPALYLWQHLELVYGIGAVTAGQLREAGMTDIRDLKDHQRYGPEARRVIKAIEHADLAYLRSCGAREAELACYFSTQDFMVVDIETTGLARALPLFLIGLAWYDAGSWQRRQLFARGFEEEKAVLWLAGQLLAEKAGLVSYNGRAFDAPYVKARMAVHHMKPPGFLIHYDVYQEAKRLAGLENRRLPTVVEHILGEQRENDTPGSLAPELYHAYMQQPSAETIKPVLEHNARDLADLCRLFDVARQAAYGLDHNLWEGVS